MRPLLGGVLWLAIALSGKLSGESFDAAPFGLPLPEGHGLMWEDPREVHQVIVSFSGAVPSPETVSLEYWGSRWPHQRVPKTQEPGGGNVGWMELGNWYNGGWRPADTEVRADGQSLVFTFRPLNAKEFPKLNDYAVPFRYTLKIRLKCQVALPPITSFRVVTDSLVVERGARLVFEQSSGGKPGVAVFNGSLKSIEKAGSEGYRLRLNAVENNDPNTFDRTLVTVTRAKRTFTFALDDLAQGALFLPEFGVAVTLENDLRDFAAVASEQAAHSGQSLYDRVAIMPEQTWPSAWEGLPRKTSRIYFPLGLDGGRQRFRLNEDGSINFRSNDGYLKSLPGRDTPRLELEPAPVKLGFGLPVKATDRFLEPGALPVCHSTWETNGIIVHGTAFVTELDGTKREGPVPDADAFAVFICQLVFSNSSSSVASAALPILYEAGGKRANLRLTEEGSLLRDAPAGGKDTQVRGQITVSGPVERDASNTGFKLQLKPAETTSFTIKIPYLALSNEGEHERLSRLDFETEWLAVASYWRKRQNDSARIMTPEPVLNDFYRAHARHLLINCEREPNSTRRIARVGSFSYGAYGNESCMMVVDLDRRGYHEEARQCLDTWLHYQGTVKLPGDFESKDGIFYGAGGYESGGYNQHHGWILWCMAEHFRFTRDTDWLRSAAPGMVAAADWIVRETRRTANRHPLERGLLPAGSLEDIGDWWTWLSTSCYTWRGLDSAAWVLAQINHPEAKRLRSEADAYHKNLLRNFRKAAELSPVVRLRDGTAVTKIPSHVHRRGRSFGWICETLEGSLHLIITGAIDPRSREATWILKDYEDNLYLSNQWGYTLEKFDEHWFGRGGMSMQACLLLGAEPYLYRDDVKHALRAIFNGMGVSHFPDVHINTEHALPNLEDWAGDHFKSSDEANACGWLRYMFVREAGDELLLGQAISREWLKPGERCGIDRAATHFGPLSLTYTANPGQITARLDGPTRNPPKTIRLRFRTPDAQPLRSVTVRGKPWKNFKSDWVTLPGNTGAAEVSATY